MKKYAILLPVELDELQDGICDLMDILEVDPVTGNLLFFSSKKEADEFMQENGVHGQIIELYL